jgi:hypothetical protein
MNIEWDSAKADQNFRKYRVSFELGRDHSNISGALMDSAWEVAFPLTIQVLGRVPAWVRSESGQVYPLSPGASAAAHCLADKQRVQSCLKYAAYGSL